MHFLFRHRRKFKRSQMNFTAQSMTHIPQLNVKPSFQILIWDLRNFCEQGDLNRALNILHVMDKHGIWVDYSSYVPLVQACINKKALAEGKLAHAHILQTGFKADTKLENKFVIMYAKCSSMGDAQKFMEQMSEQNVVTWSSLIANYARQGFDEEALGFFHQMQKRGITADQFTLASVLPACGHMETVEYGRAIHGSIFVKGFCCDIVVGSALVDMYVKCRRVQDARKVFEEMPERNVVSWTAMIVGCLQDGYLDEAEELFRKMPGRDLTSWNAMIAGYAQNGLIGKARKLFGEMPERNVESWTAMVMACAQNGLVEEAMELFNRMPEKNKFSWTAMIVGYAQNGQLEEAEELFDKMPERDLVVWNAMIRAYAQNGHVDKAQSVFDQMPERNLVSWNQLIAAYAQNGQADDARKLFEDMPRRDLVSWNTVISGYVQSGQLDEALMLFEELPQRGLVSWNIMISGYAQSGCLEETLMLFREMRKAGMKPDSVTFASVLPAYAHVGVIQQGKEVHKEILRSGFQSNVFVGSALIDMYAKCGRIEAARCIFDKLPAQDVVSWNVMITGYAMHGCGKEATRLFNQMELANVKPDGVTFVGVLSACCHAGLVDEGWQYFHRMTQEYGVMPLTEHYCCMVDLLGRAGQLDEVLDFINKMAIKPDAAIWRSFLGACRVYNNMQLGQFAAERLFELDTKNSADYVLLSNIYATSGRWEDCEKVRKMMLDRKVKKMPGRSWIEVNNKVHNFLVGDKSHPQTDKIYAMLENLAGQMKESGHDSDTNFVLHDVEEEQKERFLNYHSEKLAIAFGLINTSPGTVIRIVKNLRVCGDCHSAIKFLSKIVEREIVVRDAIRFHHFKDGQCSCGDYY
ncbi:pentatricopeptide repeat-containing protein At1g09410, mitochondrial [Cryptomeria japonica]|uniref:pentatricopeptide repeat-containing protein At1g09410, mitochondrial n=1 Tax=Cryptomeria japonica TaxID=3369 RepID=UPI0027DA317E|nr:pentatricopeptide repeat-containing protein At1g09410, mitochondrial [Cryptomeria japonica]